MDEHVDGTWALLFIELVESIDRGELFPGTSSVELNWLGTFNWLRLESAAARNPFIAGSVAVDVFNDPECMLIKGVGRVDWGSVEVLGHLSSGPSHDSLSKFWLVFGWPRLALFGTLICSPVSEASKTLRSDLDEYLGSLGHSVRMWPGLKQSKHSFSSKAT